MNKNVILIVFPVVFSFFFLSGCDSYKQNKNKKAIPEAKEGKAAGLVKPDIDVESFNILGKYIQERDGYPVLTIDSVEAVNKLQVDPATYRAVKEGLRWKKGYPAQDFLRLRTFVVEKDNRWVIGIDSITAVDSLKVDPRAYKDLKENIRECNRVGMVKNKTK